MARPTKQGVDYFPLDVDLDSNIELLIAETGPSALSVLISLWQLIYKEEGYFVKYSDDLFLLMRRRIMIDIKDAKLIIDKTIERGIFDKTLFDKYKILTSNGIQKRYIAATKKKKTVKFRREYLLTDVSGSQNVSVCVVSGDGNATKEKEEVKVKVNKGLPPKKSSFKKPTIEECFEYCNDQYQSEMFYNYYESNGWKVGKNKMANWRSALTNWVKRSKDYNSPQSSDPYKPWANGMEL